MRQSLERSELDPPSPKADMPIDSSPIPGGTPELAVKPAVTLLTGGSDKPYVFGLCMELLSKGAVIDLIGSDELDCADFQGRPGLNFFNLRGDQRTDASLTSKVSRIVRYYAKLMRYAASAKPRVFHILWNNRFETFDRTLLMLYYRLLGKKIVLTAHNVNTHRRDARDSFLNRSTLKIQYRLSDHIFVHTEKMKRELVEGYGAKESQVSVIPFGINNAVPNTQLTTREAKQRLGFGNGEKTLLFFGRITPYKGLEYLIRAFLQVSARQDGYRLIIAGRPDNCDEQYWSSICEAAREGERQGKILFKPGFIPDEDTEVYFKAADVFVLPYREIYQSGVLFLGYSFGLPVLASDVGSLKEEIIEGKTGFVFRPEDTTGLAEAIETYFASDLYKELFIRRQEIQAYAEEQHSWDVVGRATMKVHGELLSRDFPQNA